eukprot:jgi/Galph1/5936/GphlegSOOS_G4546.1
MTEDSSFSQAFQFLKESDFYSLADRDAAESSLQPVASSVPVGSRMNQVVEHAKAKQFIVVNQTTQTNNRVNGFIKQVLWGYGNIVPDYLLGPYTCALFLRVSEHRLQPCGVYERVKAIGKQFRLRILLCLVDVEDFEDVLKEITKLCVFQDFTFICTRSEKEAARYLEAYFAFENKPTDILKEKTEHDYISQVETALTSLKAVNKTDAVQLIMNFKSFHSLVNASEKEWSQCPGIGPTKVQQLTEAFKKPFRKGS